MTWNPISEQPQSVGRYRYMSEYHSEELVAHWDGRMFRDASSGRAITPFGGDMWAEDEK